MARRGTSPASPASSVTREWTAGRCARGRARSTASPATARTSGQRVLGSASGRAASLHHKMNLRCNFSVNVEMLILILP